ncbi:MAG: YggS family pyridoxal phosphate-dependent enzyme [Fibrobacterota bacterium]|nr:YggS family pyridoxal phosphate-dependent enzyme [Fibrobacterota bacterium]QQS05452.1 MAG: YggS family pyridoxal phosphate-dependent enzyme [Fibrobacterota bacterium]
MRSRLESLETRLQEACRKAGRSREEVVLVAVSKRHPASAIDDALGLGLTEFGENYVQEALDKFPRPGANLHFIGHLQRNKVRKILPISSLVHGVGSLSVLDAVDRISGEEGLSAKFLIQLHLTGEPTKTGFSAEELSAALDACHGLQHAKLCGFMAMAPLDGDLDSARKTFAHARQIADRARSRFPQANILSMGMSHDLEAAIHEGATHVRVGTALFGERTAT